MKQLTVIGLIVAMLISLPVAAQETDEDKKAPKTENDTLKIKAGEREILIIRNQKIADEIEALKSGKLEFKQNISMFQDSIRETEKALKETEDPEKREALKAKIEDFKKQIEAMEKGIERIEEEIAYIKNDKGREDKKDAFDFGPDFKKDFDWPFKKDVAEFEGHWAGIDLGLNNFMNAGYGFDLANDSVALDGAKSWTFALNILELDLPLGTEKIGLTTGLGFKLNSYYLDKQVQLTLNGDDEMRLQETDLDYDKNKLNIWHLRVPLLLEFQFPVGENDKKLYFGGGPVGGLRLGATHKNFFTENGIDKENFANHDFNIYSFRYSFRAQVGFDIINVYAEYSPMKLFNQEHYEAYPVSIGLKLVNF